MNITTIYRGLLLLTIAFCVFHTDSLQAQKITFENQDYKAISVYDTWEESPFRTGKLKGNCIITENFLRKESPNQSSRMLAVQRSRYGSNTFGARIDLKQTFELTTAYKYVHVMIYKPTTGRVMLVGLGKRKERAGQSPEAEQFWALATDIVQADTWTDAVFAIKGNGGIDIHSLVVVPDCESPHNLKEDYMCYIDEIEINNNSKPRFIPNNISETSKASGVTSTNCTISNANRNGEVVSATDGAQLVRYTNPSGMDFRIRMNPERGFTYSGITVRYTKDGSKQREEITFEKKLFDNDEFTIPGKYMIGDVEIEGLFVEKK